MKREPEKLAEGTLISHLLELRARLLRMMIALVVVMIPCAYFGNDLFDLLAQPLTQVLPRDAQIIAIGVTSPFTTPFKLGAYVAVLLTMPYILFEIWGFIAPALYRHEKQLALPVLIGAIVLFYLGVAFAYFGVFPGLLKFLVATTPGSVKLMTDINEYLRFTMTMCLSFGIAFEMPVVVVLLTAVRIVTVETLRASRGYVVIGVAILSALLNPANDAVSQLAMLVPMLILYEGGILASRYLLRLGAQHRPQEE
jgi:sec-independent protein translocase protein TatC